MNTYSVYIHTTPSGKKYVGITKNNPLFRWRNGTAYSRNVLFGKAIKKYGWENIEHTIVANGLTKEEAERKEVELIALYNTSDHRYGYNISLGGHIAYPNPSEEFKEKIRKAVTGANNHKSIPIRCIQTGEVFESVHIAAKTLNLKKSNILRVLSGRNKHTGGFSFEAIRVSDRKEPIHTKNREEVASLFRKKVAVYNLEGELIDICNSRTEASQKYDVKIGAISNCIHHSKKTAKGYIFRDAEEYPAKKVEKSSKNIGVLNPSARAVNCLDKQGNLLKYYEYATLASKELGIDLSSIIKCCKGKNKTCGGYVWRYANPDQYPAGWEEV